MSISTIDIVMGRIEVASEESPIAVFKTKERGLYEAQFASTVFGKKRVKKDKALIGVFHNKMPKSMVKARIRSFS